MVSGFEPSRSLRWILPDDSVPVRPVYLPCHDVQGDPFRAPASVYQDLEIGTIQGPPAGCHPSPGPSSISCPPMAPAAAAGAAGRWRRRGRTDGQVANGKRRIRHADHLVVGEGHNDLGILTQQLDQLRRNGPAQPVVGQVQFLESGQLAQLGRNPTRQIVVREIQILQASQSTHRGNLTRQVVASRDPGVPGLPVDPPREVSRPSNRSRRDPGIEESPVDPIREECHPSSRWIAGSGSPVR